MDTNAAYFLIFTIAGLVAAFSIAYYILRKIGKNPNNILPVNFAQRIKVPLLLFFIAVAIHILATANLLATGYNRIAAHIGVLLLIASITWFLILFTTIVKTGFIRKFDITAADNLNARRVFTQFSILQRVAIFLIVVFAIGAALMSFESIRSIGVSVFASAGVAGIILGFSAQKALGTLLAGIQIAITQPIRIDDVVIVEGEWGWIEQIYLTYVVIRIWDKRRLVVPTTYFIEKPFQNWTRENADILGTVFIYTDFMMPIDPLRSELTRLLSTTHLWDGKVNVLQVTNAVAAGMEIRALVSSKDSPTNWDLRVFIREKLIGFIQQNYPESLPKTRVEIQDGTKGYPDAVHTSNTL
ncbi:mechanosensitive ion channel family protein [Flavobacterium psychrotrophum]|uniref:mechanosensitive ion channel family protein n=1 Tax=Flavobacterium psychrotrophum TaxID=2294119 RepID=UPI000E30E2E0|nr:mechanosensitive ion channel domain-containing protein [Flavobacterium psychrotrophum]